VLIHHVVIGVAFDILHLFLALYHIFAIRFLVLAKVLEDILALLHGFKVAEESFILRIIELLYILAAHT
jgi:hypothetical protein